MPDASSNSRRPRRKPRLPRPSDPSPSFRELELYRAIVSTFLALIRGKPQHITRQKLLEILTSALELIPEEGNLDLATADFPVAVDHLFTLWRSNPGYLKDGLPRALPLRGPFPSIESLLHEADPNVDLKHALNLLQPSKYLKKVGTLFLPGQIVMGLRGTPYQAQRQLRTLAAHTANLDHNAAPGKSWPSWREQTAECPNVPISKLQQFREYVFRQSEEQLKDYDAYLHRLERSRKANERTVRAGVTIVQYDRSYRQQSRAFNHTMRQLLNQLATPVRKPTPRKRRTAP